MRGFVMRFVSQEEKRAARTAWAVVIALTIACGAMLATEIVWGFA
jgi:hypothetical protein